MNRNRASGFTLIEMLIVVAIVGLLAGTAVGQYRRAMNKTRESLLRENLYIMRSQINAYVAANGEHPFDLQQLVIEGYLREIPVDPVTRSRETWITIQALPTDERADVYSLGCILFRMLSGEPPFPGGAILEVLRKHIEQPPPRVTSPRGPLPDLLVECVARALAKRPQDRLRSMGEMRGVLDQALKQLAGNGRSPRG